MFQWKNVFVRRFLLRWKLLKYLWKRKKMRETYTRWWTLGWGIAEISLPPWKKEQKIQVVKGGRNKMLGDCWAVFNIFMNNKGPSHTFFFTTFGKNFIIQIIWNVILYHWHVSPAINYGKFLVLLFLKIFPAPTSFSFFIWFPPNNSLSENIKILTAPLHLINSL